MLEYLVVQPHLQCAHVELSLSSNEEMDDFMYSGLEVIHVEVIHVEVKSADEEPRLPSTHQLNDIIGNCLFKSRWFMTVFNRVSMSL